MMCSFKVDLNAERQRQLVDEECLTPRTDDKFEKPQETQGARVEQKQESRSKTSRETTGGQQD